MRIDHHAYQKGTQVAGFGLLLQVAIGLTLLIFGLVAGKARPEGIGDTTFVLASLYVLYGSVVWTSLLLVMYQHKLERLEALEADELAESRTVEGSVFDRASDDLRVAARRLRLMHKWLMPAASALLVVLLGLTAYVMLRWFASLDAAGSDAEFAITRTRGWGVAICIAFALVSFIWSRFVAGMAKQPAWQNLRGGAGWTVGTALVLAAIAVGIGFTFFDNTRVIRAVAFAIPIYMIGVGAEIVLNLILNFYRPRIPGEVPRPAYDSKVLSLLAAPDSIVRSINEAVNYQFGFDITSSWGYQLLLRSFTRLLIFGIVVLFALSCVTIVEPHEQAVRLRGGRVVGGAHGPGPMLKLPWPIETAAVFDVSRPRELVVTERVRNDDRLVLWEDDLSTDGELTPFIVQATPERALYPDGRRPERSRGRYALVDAEILLQYRIRRDEGGLESYLRFVPEVYQRRSSMSMRDRALRALALREVRGIFARHTIDEILTTRRIAVADEMANAVQEAFDAHATGVDVVAVNVPLVRPADDAAGGYDDLMFAIQEQRQRRLEAEQRVATGLTLELGDTDAAAVVARIERLEALRAASDDPDDPEIVALRLEIEQTLREADGRVANLIISAERDRWVELMGARTQLERVRSEVVPFRAAPRLYVTRALMALYAEELPDKMKYVIGIDPDRVRIDVESVPLSSVLTFEGAADEEGAEP